MSVRPVGFVVAASIAALGLVSGGVWLWASHSSNSEFSSDTTPETIPRPTVLLAGWNQAIFRERQGSMLALELTPEHAMLTVDLAQTAVFDCRNDCLEDVHEGLLPVTAQESICLYSEAGRGVLKLWINRYTCPVLQTR